VNTWPELSAIFCGSIENNSFMQFTASASNVQLRIWGSCTSGTGIQMLAFTSTSGLCGSGSVLSHGCFSPLNLNTAPITGIPLTFTGMIPGQTYYLMVDGFAGAVCNYKIGADYGVQVSAFVTPSTSNICLGTTVPLAAGGGNGTYTWNPSPTLSGLTGSSVVASPLATGTYTYTVNSASVDTSCPANTATATINVFDVPTPNAGIDDTVCFNPTGTIINLNGTSSNPVNATLWQYVAPPGPTPTFMFAPSAASPVTSVIVNQPGLYKFILRETNTICGVFRDTVDVLVLSHQQTLSYVPPTCNGGSDGTISVSNPNAVEYSFDNGTTYQTAPTLGGFAAGTYSICSKNYFGCQICSSITIVDLPAVTISVSNDTLICENGTATISAVGSNGNNFSFAWSHTGDLLGTQSVSPLTPGYYYVSGTSDVGCVTPQDSIYVDILPPLSGSISSGVTICPTFNTIITANAMDGNGGPYTHTWSTGTVGNGASHSVNVSPMTTSTYSVTISDGCETTPITFSTDVTVAPVPQPSFDVVVDSMCSPGLFTVYNTTDTSMVQTAQWFISDGQGFNSIDSIVTSAMPTGSYDVTLTIVSPDGCVNTITEDDYLVAMPIPLSKFRFSPVVVTAYSTQVSFVNLSVGNTYNYWDFTNASPMTSTTVNPTTTFPEAIVDNYLVTLIVESQFGCRDTSYEIVEVLPEVLLFAPNTFTPDGDEHNSTWHIFIEGIDPSDFELVVYDRWGEVIWKSFDPDADWDGMYKGKLVPTGVYNWSLKTNDALNGKGYVWTGHMNVLH